MIETDFANLLVTKGFGTLGTDLFVGDPDPTVDNCLWIVRDPSDETQRYVNTRYATLGVWGRNKSTQTLATTMESLDDSVHGTNAYTTANYEIYFIHTSLPPQDFDRDENRRKLYMMKFRIIYRVLSEIS